MATYKQIPTSKICEVLMHAASGVSSVCGFSLVTSDMAYSFTEFSNKSWGGLKEPYYFAIRDLGTESGLKDYCIDRCKTLGYPIIIAKIEQDKVCDFNMTITFTQGWKTGDNEQMIQEFNSL